MKRWIGILLALGLLLSGCGTGAADTEIPAPQDTLTVWTPLEEEIWGPYVREFQRRSGIWVAVEQGSAEALLEKLTDAPESCDVLMGFSPEHLAAVQNLLTELSAQDSRKWAPFFQEVPVIVYNPHLIRKEAPADFPDLTDPRWQGNLVIADPAADRVSRNVLPLLQRDGEEAGKVLARFCRNLAKTAMDSDEVLECVSNGTCPLGVASESRAVAYRNRGAALVVVQREKTLPVLASACAVCAESTEKESARAFAAFLLEDSTQRHTWQALALRPAAEPGERLRDSSAERMLQYWMQEAKP